MRSRATDLLQAVAHFHDAFGVPVRYQPTMDVPEADTRAELLREEYQELREALAGDDVAAVAKEMADVIYVLFGTALAYGIRLDAVLGEVHRSNMSKLGEDGKPIYREDGKVLKGINYSPANVRPLLGLA